MVLMRVCDLATAGVFTIAYASANLFMNMGCYGMRNFQASDVQPQYGFRTYARSRIVTCMAMIVCSGAYLAFSAITVGYAADKVVAIALMTIFKAIDAVEDVFDGNFQQHGRLDIGGKLLTMRVGSTLVIFCLCAALTHSLVIALATATAYGVVFLVAGLLIIQTRFGMPIPDNGIVSDKARKTMTVDARKAKTESVKRLLRDCLPLFLAAFLLFYLGNAPKYAIDAIMDDGAQAIYGFIAMPVFVVGLLAQFVYMPLVEPLSMKWANGARDDFIRGFVKQCGIIALITLVCDIAAWFLGVPVLNLLYATDVSPYLIELVVLVTGGAFYALANLFIMGITIMRRQKKLVFGYASVSVFALIASQPFVASWGITGASWIYFICMGVLAVWFALLFFRNAMKKDAEHQ